MTVRLLADENLDGDLLRALPIGRGLDDLLLLIECGVHSDFQDRVWRLPLR